MRGLSLIIFSALHVLSLAGNHILAAGDGEGRHNPIAAWFGQPIAVDPQFTPKGTRHGHGKPQSSEPAKNRSAEGETQAIRKPSDPPPASVTEKEAHIVNSNGDVHFEDKEGTLEEEALAEFVLIPIVVAIIAALFLGGYLEKCGITWLPESAVTLAVGVCLGFFMKSNIGYTAFFKDEDVFNKTCSYLLTLFLLPILIFEAGWSLRRRDFASQFQYILLFAVVGSLISFLVVGCLIFYTGQSGLHGIDGGRTAFVYASLIAATDPVATLATYSKLKVDPLLNIMVFGDSIFNDAVAIVLFKVLNSDAIMGTPDSRPTFQELTLQILGGIVKIFFGSLGVGVVVALLFLLLLRFFDLRESPRLEILSLVAVGYGCFAVGEVVGMSGIIATIFCSMILGIYARPHLSAGGAMLGSFFLKQIASLMDTAIFLLTGVCFVNLTSRGLWFGGCAMLFCLVGRAAAVFPLGFLTNAIKRAIGKSAGRPEEDWHLLSTNAMVMMWHAGLRGAIALTLCMQIGPWADALDGPHTRHVLQTGTSFLICVFLLVFGGSTETCLRKCGISMGKESAPDKLYRVEAVGHLQRLCKVLDEKIMVPFFVGDARRAAKIQESEQDVEIEGVLQAALKRQHTFGSIL